MSRQSLILVPTEFELQLLKSMLNARFSCDVSFELCGFGPIAAAARTAGLIAERRPSRVLLAGIAGGIGNRILPGQAAVFGRVACFGIGAGSGDRFISADQMGWPQWKTFRSHPDPHAENAAAQASDVSDLRSDRNDLPDVIGDSIDLPINTAFWNKIRSASGTGDTPSDSTACENTLLTVCAAAGDRADAERRAELFPDATAEDMEGFGVAIACRLAGTPLAIVRGISNAAGNRDRAQWRVEQALRSASELVLEWIHRSA